MSRSSITRATTQISHRIQGHILGEVSRCRAGLLSILALLVGIGLVACAPNLGAATSGWAPAAARDGVVYVVTLNGEVKALGDSGFEGVRLMWNYEGQNESLQGAYNPPAVGEDLIYVSAIDGYLYALEKGTGTLGETGWRRPQGQATGLKPLVGGPALDENLGIVVVGSEDHNLYAYDAATGRELWQFAAGDKIWSTPVIDQETVYFGSHDQNVYALDANTGEEKWRFATGGTVLAQPLVWRDMVIIGSFDRKLYAIDTQEGVERWSFESGNWFWAGAVASSNVVFASSMDGNVYALDQGGNRLWEHQMGSPIVSTPVLLPRGLVVASREGQVSLLDPTAGDVGLRREVSALALDPAKIKAPLFALPVNEDELSQTGVQDARDDQKESVFVGAQDGTVRRIQVKSVQNQVWCFDTENDETCQ